jgi:prepilin peptidase CpaA
VGQEDLPHLVDSRFHSVPEPVIITTTAIVFLAICVATDVTERRIPNTVSAPAIVLGLALNGLSFGAQGLAASIGGAILLIAVLFLPFALGGVGAGDVKMMGAVGALLGPRLALASVVVGMLLGGILMVVHLARRGLLRQKLTATGYMFATAAVSRSLEPLRMSPTAPGAVSLPYSVPLALGTLLVLASHAGGQP